MFRTFSGLFNSGGSSRVKDTKDLEPETETFSERWGWFVPLNDLCGNDLILRKLWLETNIIEFLNQLSYIKEKHNMENPVRSGKQY